MEKRKKLSFQLPVGTPKEAVEPQIEKKLEYEPQEQVEQPTQLEINIENYLQAFIYFSNLCKEKGLPSEFVMILWQIFNGK